jgi:acyl-CoA synthetase (AMP-forming)/AMP-acid ligase II
MVDGQAPAWRDGWLLGAIAAAFAARAVPLALWWGGGCTRDECSYRLIAENIVAGQGMTAPEGWLWAPLYPYLLATSLWATGSVYQVRYLQLAVALISVWLVYRLGERVCLAVILRNGTRVNSDALLAHLSAGGLSKYDMPEYFAALEAFPLTASGKILKRELMELTLAGKIKPEPLRWKG